MKAFLAIALLCSSFAASWADVRTATPEEIRACDQAARSLYPTTTQTGKYTPRVITTSVYKTDFGTMQRMASEFGGHKFLSGQFFTSTTDSSFSGEDHEGHFRYCVLDDANNVLGLETEITP